MSQSKANMYKSVKSMLAKTEDAYPQLLSESFVNANNDFGNSAGMHLLLSHMSGRDTILRDSALDLTANLMQADPSICVQLLKVNILSNLILSVLRQDLTTLKQIEAILQAAIDCKHRQTLLNKS